MPDINSPVVPIPVPKPPNKSPVNKPLGFSFVTQTFWSFSLVGFIFLFIAFILMISPLHIQPCDFLGGRPENTLGLSLFPADGGPIGNNAPVCRQDELPFGPYLFMLCPCICCVPKVNMLIFLLLLVSLIAIYTRWGIRYFRRLISLKRYIFNLIWPVIVLMFLSAAIMPLKVYLDRIQPENPRDNVYEYEITLTPSPPTVCDFSLNLPENYYFGDANNSPFYGLSDKDAGGKSCKVILGPNYVPGWEGFSGENIQINVYRSESTTLDKIRNSCCKPVIKSGDSNRYERSGYGGTDQVLLKSVNDKIYEIIWRNNPDDLENIIREISTQLE